MGSAVFTSWRAASRPRPSACLGRMPHGHDKGQQGLCHAAPVQDPHWGRWEEPTCVRRATQRTSSARVGSATRAPSRSEQRTACATRKEGSTSALHTSRHAGNETEAHSSPSWRPMVWPCGSGGGLTDAEAVTRSTNKAARRIGTETGAPVDSQSSQSPHRFGRARTCDRPGHTVTVVGTLEAAERFRPAHVPRGHSQP